MKKKIKKFIIYLSEKIFSYGISIPLIFFGLTVFIINSKIGLKDLKLDSSYIVVALMSFLMFSIFSKKLFEYLNDDYDDKGKNNNIITKYILDFELANNNKKIENAINEALGKNSEILNVEKNIYKKIETDFEENIIKRLEDKYNENLQKDVIYDHLYHQLDPLTKNIEKYIERIQRNSIVNLFIGIVGSLTAILILAYSILSNKTFLDLQTFSIYFIPRFTFVIFIQLFAFFFLKLYKNNLEDAKYFQNELTNLTAKSVSIKISYLINNTNNLPEIIKELSKIERNFKLSANETTIDIEKAKIETELDKTILTQIKELLNKK